MGPYLLPAWDALLDVMKEDRSIRDQIDEALDALVGRSPKSLTDLLETYPADSLVRRIVESAETARGGLEVKISPETKAKHMSMLMDEARRQRGPQTVAAPAPVRPAPRAARWPRRLALVALALSLLVVPTAAMAREAGPEDGLYGVKLAIENVRLALETSAEGDAGLHLEFAAERLAEIESLLAQGKTDLAAELLARFERHRDAAEDGISTLDAKGQDAAVLASHLSEVLTHHIDVLGALVEEAECDPADPTAGKPQCKGLLTALENSSKVLDKHPLLGGEGPGAGAGTQAPAGKPDNPGRPDDAPGRGEPSHPGPAGAGGR